MKNKEIEELLNELKDGNWNYYPSDLIPYKVLLMEERDLLLSYMEQLKNKNESLLEDRKQLLNLVEQLENNRDKAIEIIDLMTPELWNISNKMTYRLKDIKYILQGEGKDGK